VSHPSETFSNQLCAKLTPATPHQGEPACQQTDAADRSDRSQPSPIRKGEDIQAPAKDNDSQSEERPGQLSNRFTRGNEEKEHRVDKMVENRRLPDSRRLIRLEKMMQAMRPKGAQRNRAKTEETRDAKEHGAGCGAVFGLGNCNSSFAANRPDLHP
jgi:hypothetical protein